MNGTVTPTAVGCKWYRVDALYPGRGWRLVGEVHNYREVFRLDSRARAEGATEVRVFVCQSVPAPGEG